MSLNLTLTHDNLPPIDLYQTPTWFTKEVIDGEFASDAFWCLKKYEEWVALIVKQRGWPEAEEHLEIVRKAVRNGYEWSYT